MRVVVFWEEGFPALDTSVIRRETLERGCGADVAFCGRKDLAQALQKQPDVFVNPYGSAFPKPCWSAFTDYLRRGGSWVNAGGNPLSRPVRWEDGRWKVECEQRAYAMELRLNQAIETEVEDLDWRWTDVPGQQPAIPVPGVRRCWSLQVRFAEDKEFPEESGSSALRLASMSTLLEGRRGGRLLAAPVVCVDRFYGDFAGGRWALVNAELESELSREALAALIRHAACGAVEFSVRPSFACYEMGETPALRIAARASRLSCPALVRLRRSHGAQEPLDGLADEEGLLEAQIALGGEFSFATVTPEAAQGEVGLCGYTAELIRADTHERLAVCDAGFWRYRPDILTSGLPLSVDSDYFWRGGQPYPVTGTTYMAGDAHRKFLFEPNPMRWDRDFAEMKAAGVNLVRTGIWTGWSRVMMDPGAVDEGALRAFTAFLLTAAKYDIPVIFTFFAFLPPAWGGANPYLDPQAVAAQKAFAGAFAGRFRDCNILMWDFINEPSFSSKAHEWYTRPNYDRYEQEAWRAWLLEQASEDEWRERWRLTPNESLALPAIEDFQDRQIYQDTHPFKAMSYRLFAQEMFRRWTQEMAGVIRANGNPHQLITVGQDEGGTGERPAPHFYGMAVDFTSNHSWWQNDDLLWDSVFTKLPDRPNLIEETGIMFVEAPDGAALRTPQQARNLLEHKMALAFAGGCAGFVQWLWNTNVYMDSDNEAGIGFHRADGTEKPEMEAFRGVAAFMRKNAKLMTGRRQEEAVVVIPHSNHFSVRNYSDGATRRAVRILEYDLGIAVRCVSELRMHDVGDPKLIVLPSARTLTEECWQALLRAVDQGATLLVTGFVEADEFWRPVERLGLFGLQISLAPVARQETVVLAGQVSGALFGADKIARVQKAIVNGESAQRLHILDKGKGRLVYCGLPVELSSGGAAEEVYRTTARTVWESVRASDVRRAGILETTQVFEHAQLTIVVHEGASTAETGGEGGRLKASPGRIAMAFTDRRTGEDIAVYKV